MKPSLRLYQQACRITLFTRKNCSLCTNAKDTLSKVWDKRPFEYKEIDVMTPDGKNWRDLYEFDTPVIHISSAKSAQESTALSGKAQKLMHRFKFEELIEKMDLIEKENQ